MSDSTPLSLHVRAVKGTIVLAAPYNEGLVDLIHALPRRRFQASTREWIVPAGRDDLPEVLRLVATVEERGIPVVLDPSVRPRFNARGLTRVLLCERADGGDAVELVGPYDPDRLPALRGLPQRSYDADRKSWVVPLTRDGALKTMQLLERDERHVVTDRALAALHRTARARGEAGAPSGVVIEGRRSPTAHMRYVKSGPIFNARHARRVYVDERDGDGNVIGWCVPVTVDPIGRRRREAARRAGTDPNGGRDREAPAQQGPNSAHAGLG